MWVCTELGGGGDPCVSTLRGRKEEGELLKGEGEGRRKEREEMKRECIEERSNDRDRDR